MAIAKLFETCEIDTNWRFEEMKKNLYNKDVFTMRILNNTIFIEDIIGKKLFELLFEDNKLQNITIWKQEHDLYREKVHGINDFLAEDKRLITVGLLNSKSGELWRRKFNFQSEEFREIIISLIQRGLLKEKDYDQIAIQKYPDKVVLDRTMWFKWQ